MQVDTGTWLSHNKFTTSLILSPNCTKLTALLRTVTLRTAVVCSYCRQVNACSICLHRLHTAKLRCRYTH